MTFHFPRSCFRICLLVLFACGHVEGGRPALFQSGSGVTPPHTKMNRVWIYTSVAADYDGAAMLPHFINHYKDLGIKPEHFLVVVNHNPEATHLEPGATPVEDVVAVLDSFGIKYHLWLDQYSSEKLYKIRLQLLNVVPVDDWIVHADSDELHDYGVNNLPKYLQKMDQEGVNEIKGQYVDRASATGELTSIQPSPGIFMQYPLKCQVIKSVANGRDTKAMAYKGYWRTDRGNHQVLRPAKAMSYLGPPDVPGGENRAVVDAEDLFPLSPYYREAKRYSYQCLPNQDMENGKVSVKLPPGVKCTVMQDKKTKAPPGWSRNARDGLVHHFKWHAGVIDSVKERLKYYRGDGEDGKPGSTPKYAWFKDSEKLLDGVVANERIDLKKNKCKK